MDSDFLAEECRGCQKLRRRGIHALTTNIDVFWNLREYEKLGLATPQLVLCLGIGDQDRFCVAAVESLSEQYPCAIVGVITGACSSVLEWHRSDAGLLRVLTKATLMGSNAIVTLGGIEIARVFPFVTSGRLDVGRLVVSVLQSGGNVVVLTYDGFETSLALYEQYIGMRWWKQLTLPKFKLRTACRSHPKERCVDGRDVTLATLMEENHNRHKASRAFAWAQSS
jgi:hypothetical protein